MATRRAGEKRATPWVGWTLAIVVVPLVALGAAGVANRFAKQSLQGAVGRTGALLLDLLFNVTLHGGDQELCLLVGDSRTVPFDTWNTRCRVVNVAQYGSSTFFWHGVRHAMGFMLPDRAEVAVWLGVNDLRHDLNTDGAVSATNLIELIEVLAQGKRRVWILPQIPVLHEDPTLHARFEQAGHTIDADLRARFAKDPRVRFVDLSPVVGTPLQPKDTAYADPVHLTQEATRRVRELLDRAWNY